MGTGEKEVQIAAEETGLGNIGLLLFVIEHRAVLDAVKELVDLADTHVAISPIGEHIGHRCNLTFNEKD